MLRSLALRAALAAALAAGAAGAQASTVVLSSWTFGSGNNVNASAPVYNGQAGGFSGTLDGQALMTYCVELTQVFYWNTPYTNYVDTLASAYFTGPDNKADKLGRLLSYVADTAGAVDNAAESTSLQLAIWNIVYDTDTTLAGHTGATFSDTSGYASYATALLTASQNWANSMNVWVLASPTAQDQLHWSRVPEPATLALVTLALGAAGVARRRRA
jgi:hypothetical protein